MRISQYPFIPARLNEQEIYLLNKAVRSKLDAVMIIGTTPYHSVLYGEAESETHRLVYVVSSISEKEENELRVSSINGLVEFEDGVGNRIDRLPQSERSFRRDYQQNMVLCAILNERRRAMCREARPIRKLAMNIEDLAICGYVDKGALTARDITT